MTDVVINFHLSVPKNSVHEVMKRIQKNFGDVAKTAKRTQNSVKTSVEKTTREINEQTAALNANRAALERIRGMKYDPFTRMPGRTWAQHLEKQVNDFRTMIPTIGAGGRFGNDPVHGGFLESNMFGGPNVSRGIEKESLRMMRRQREMADAVSLMGMGGGFDIRKNQKTVFGDAFNMKKQLAKTTVPPNFGKSIEVAVARSIGRGVTSGFGNKVAQNWMPANVPTGKSPIGAMFEDAAKLRQVLPVIIDDMDKLQPRKSTAKERQLAFLPNANEIRTRMNANVAMVSEQIKRSGKGFGGKMDISLPVIDVGEWDKVGEKSRKAINKTANAAKKAVKPFKQLGFVNRDAVRGARNLGLALGLSEQEIRGFNKELLTSANRNRQMAAGLGKIADLGNITDGQMRQLNRAIVASTKSNVHFRKSAREVADVLNINRSQAEGVLSTMNKYGPVIDNARQKTGLMTRALHGMSQAFEMVRGAIVYGLFLLVTGAVAALTAEVFKFDHKMREMNSLLRASEDGFQKLSNEVVKLSTKVPQAASDLASAMRDIVSAGFRGDETMRMLNASAVLATGGFIDTKTAANALVTTMNAYNMEAKHAGAVSDILFGTMEYGIITMAEISEHFSKFTPLAAQAKIPLHDVAAAMAVMTKRGVSAGRASTGLQRIISRLIRQDEGDKLMQALGGNVDAATLAQKGLIGVIKELNIALGNSITKNRDAILSVEDYQAAINLLAQDANGIGVETLSAMFPDMETLQTVVMLAGEAGSEIVDISQKLVESQGATQRAFNEAKKSYLTQVKIIRNQVQAAWIHFATAVLPAVIKMLGMTAKIILTVAEVFKFLQRNLVILIPALIMLAFIFKSQIAGALLVAAGAAQAFWASVFAPVALVIGAFMLIGGVIQSVSEGTWSAASFMAGAWNGLVIVIWAVGIALWGNIAIIQAVAAAVVGSINWIWDWMKWLADNWDKIWHNMGVWAENAMKWASNKVVEAIEWAINKAIGLLNLLIEQMNKIPNVDLELIPKVSLDGAKMDLNNDIKEISREGVNTWVETFQKWMDKLGYIPFEDFIEDMTTAIPLTNSEKLKAFFNFEIEDPEIDSDMEAYLAQFGQQTAEAVATANNIMTTVDNMSSATMNIAGAFEQAALHMVNMGYEANAVSEMLRVVKNLQMQKAMLDMLGDMRDMSEAFLSKGMTGGLHFKKINDAIAMIAESFVTTGNDFLNNLLDPTVFGSPEEIAELFARQNYISQNVNQSVVISPYIQIDGNKNQEEIMQIVDESLTEWAKNNGLSVGR